MFFGSSEAAKYIEEEAKKKEQHFSNSIIYGKQSAYSELSEVWDECKAKNWDGYDAFPIQKETFNNTLTVIEALPLGSPLPSFSAEPDGHITLEWYRHPRWILSVSVSPEGYLYYAALFGDSPMSGSEFFFGEIPVTIISLIERVTLEKI